MRTTIQQSKFITLGSITTIAPCITLITLGIIFHSSLYFLFAFPLAILLITNLAYFLLKKKTNTLYFSILGICAATIVLLCFYYLSKIY